MPFISYGGAAGGGKSYALLLEQLRHKDNPSFGSVIFRRTSGQIFNEGGLWDNALTMYSGLEFKAIQSPRATIFFKDGAKITLTHLQYEKDIYSWQGAQIPLVCCEVQTPVLMADGSYKQLRDIEVGDYVRTLTGNRRVTAVADPIVKHCVKLTVNGESQLQSYDHRVLTPKGWLCFGDGAELDVMLYGVEGKKRDFIYEHPYNPDEYHTCECVVKRAHLRTIRKAFVRHITVDVDNHYITKCGVINKNCFDELTHFTITQFFYLLTRNRSASCGVRPYVRATTNPDADSWVADFIAWYIDQETGYPIPERSGVIRYFARVGDEIYWGDTRDELIEKHKVIDAQIKSFTFIASKLTDNKILMENDPGYLGNLMAQGRVEQERLLNGNWKIKPAAGLYFKRQQVEIVPAIPHNVIAWVRAWDLAATVPSTLNPNPDATAGVLMGMLDDGRYIVADVKRVQYDAKNVRALVRNCAVMDREKCGGLVSVTIPQDPGQAGKEQAESYIRHLSGFSVKAVRPSGSKIVRAEPFSAQWQAGNVMVLAGDWNEAYFTEMEAFPESVHDDMVDASSDSFNELQQHKGWGGLVI